ncbi:hypothetical protein ACRRS0_09935 [Agarivorans sp. QJM3NY_29]
MSSQSQTMLKLAAVFLLPLPVNGRADSLFNIDFIKRSYVKELR